MKFPARLLFAAATLVAASAATAATQAWNTGGPTNNWNTTDTNWDTSSAWANGNDATFGGTGEAITLGTGVQAHNLTFDSTGYSIATNTLTLTGSTPTISVTNLADTATISSILAGTAGLTKTGAGTLTLSGANTYTGGTTVAAGTLLVDAGNYPKNASNRTALGAMSVASGATLNLLNNGAAGSFAAGQCLVIRDITLSGAGTVITSGTGVTDFWDGDNLANLTAFTGTFRATSGTMSFQTAKTSGVNAMILDTGAYLDLRTNPDANGGLTLSSLTGTGTVGASWQTMTLAVGALNASSQFDGVIQNTVPGFSNSPTIALTKIGGGTLTLTNTNTYTGRTTVNGGTLEINGGALASTSALTLGGGTLSLTGAGTTQTLNGLTTTANKGSGILLAANKTLTLGALTSAGANSALNFNTAAGGADASTSALGTSVVVLTGQTAGNVINKGFTVTDATGFGLATVDASNNVIRRTTTTLLPASGATSPTDYQINNNAGGAAADGSSSLAITASQSAGSITVDTTTAAGTLSLNSGVILSNNTWNFGGVGSNAYQITGNAGGAGLRSVASGDTITFNNYNTGVVTIASNILANGTNAVIFNGTGTTSLSGVNTYTGGTTVNAGTLIQDLSSRSGTINNIGAFTVNAGAVYELKSGTNTGADSTLFQNNSLSGTGTVRKTGAGYIGLAHTGSNLNAFDGTFDVQAGTIGVNSGTQGSGKATVGLNVSGTKLDIRTGTFVIDALNGVAGSQVFVSHTTNSTLSLGNNNGSGTFSGTIDNGGTSRTLALIKNGTGTQTLAGANTFTGGLTVNGGTLNYTGGGSVTGGGGNVLIGSGATLNLSGTTTNQLEANGTWTVNGTLANTSNKAISIRTTSLTLNGGTINSTQAVDTPHGAFFSYLNTTITANGTGNVISGNGDLGINTGTTLTLGTALAGDRLLVSTVLKNVGGAGAVTKTGLGTVTFTGANTYTGGTTISGGTLLANNATGSGLGAGAVAVNAGTLGGTGFITGGAITVASGATLQGGVGAASGTLTIDSNVTLSADSIIRLALGDAGASSTLARTGGTWAFDANQTFDLIDLGVTEGGVYTLITGLTGSEAGLSTIATGWHNTGDLIGTFSLSGNNVIFTAVPEPSTYGLIGAGALAAVAFVRRRRRSAGKVVA